jgi:hypothetical protein
VTGAANPEEAAAIAAAIERFLHETSPAQLAPAHGPDPWTRAAMLEGVMRDRSAIAAPVEAHPWINT